MRTIAIINQKGGCGKTTCSINLAAALAQEGQRTLLVDMDPQSHCALGLAVPETQIKYSSAELMRAGLDGSLAVDDVVWQIARFFDLIPSSMALAAIEAQLQHAPDKDRRLAQVLSTCQDKYDFCIIDCPPSIGLLTFNALRAATEVVVPVETGYFSMEGAKKQHRTIEMLARRAGHNVQFSILPTMYDVRTKLAREILAEIKRHFTGHLLPQVINFNAKLKEAASFGQPITEYDATSRGMQDFEELAQHLVANPPARPEPIEPEESVSETEDATNPALSRAAELVERARMLSQRTAEISQRLSTPAPAPSSSGSGATGGMAARPTTPPARPASPVTPTSPIASQPAPEPIISPDHMFGTRSASSSGSTPSTNSGAEAQRTAPAAPTNPQAAGSAAPGAAARGADRLSGIMSAAGLKPPVAPLPSYITELPQNTPQHPSLQDPSNPAAAGQPEAPAAKAPRTVEDYESGFYAPAAHKQQAVQPTEPNTSPSPTEANLPANGMFGTSGANSPSTLVPDTGLKAQIPENLDPRIADLYGVRKTSQGLLFVQPVNGAATMAIAGDFNGWNPQQTKLKINEEHNVWQAVIPVPPGRYRYRLVVDGKWVKDPYNLQVESNPFGELNNVVVVKA